MHWHYRETGWHWLDWLFMIVAMALFWAGLITVVVLVLRRGTHPGLRHAPAPPPASPEGILATRYARGDIDENEYRTRLETLRRQGDDHAGR